MQELSAAGQNLWTLVGFAKKGSVTLRPIFLFGKEASFSTFRMRKNVCGGPEFLDARGIRESLIACLGDFGFCPSVAPRNLAGG